MIGRLAFWIAGSTFGGWVVGLVFTYFSALLPVRNAAQNPALKIFHHPKPIDDPHVLLVPKRPIQSALKLQEAPNAQKIWRDLAIALPLIASECAGDGARIFFNGGNRQEVAQLHLHVTSSKIFINGWETDEAQRGQQHLVLQTTEAESFADQIQTALNTYKSRLQAARGFTFVFGNSSDGRYKRHDPACLHLILDEG